MKKSISGKYWTNAKCNEYIVETIRQKHNVSDFLARLLYLQGISIDNISDFLIPTIKNSLPDPFHLLDMDKAVKRVITAIEKQEQICIFGDYDVDGATSSALLKSYFAKLGVKTNIYIPDRITEGYGPSIQSIKKLKSMDINLIITVDCGTNAHEAVAEAKLNNIDVIIIDHHLTVEQLPDAVAIVNPNRLDETTKYRYLAAVGVSFLFIIAVRAELRKLGYFTNKEEPNLMQYLDLVALGTVCDVMALIELNRVFVTKGLEIMAKRQNIGLKTLCDLSDIKFTPDCYYLGFILGPKINAGGRIGKSSLGSKLLSTNCPIQAHTIATELGNYNLERKQIENNIVTEAMNMASNQANDNIIIVYSNTWHPGVIGIVASRLKDKFNKPVVVISLDGDLGRASCRSIKDVDLGSKIAEAKMNNLLIAGGGHAMAAGFTIERHLIQDLKNFLEKIIAPDMNNIINQNIWHYSFDISISSVNINMFKEIQKLAPFGNGNPEPIFKLINVKLNYAAPLTQKHINCTLSEWEMNNSRKTIKAIAFNPEEKLTTALLSKYSKPVAMIGNIKINHWQGREEIQFIIKDLII